MVLIVSIMKRQQDTKTMALHSNHQAAHFVKDLYSSVDHVKLEKFCRWHGTSLAWRCWMHAGTKRASCELFEGHRHHECKLIGHDAGPP